MWNRFLILIVLCLILSACGTSASDQTEKMIASSTVLKEVAATSAPEQRYPDILAAEFEEAADGTFTVSVTVSSPYDTPERYADAWRILSPDGRVLGERILTHDHASEQPFTRSMSGVEIPEEIDAIIIEGRDKLYGYGGKTLEMSVPGR